MLIFEANSTKQPTIPYATISKINDDVAAASSLFGSGNASFGVQSDCNIDAWDEVDYIVPILIKFNLN